MSESASTEAQLFKNAFGSQKQEAETTVETTEEKPVETVEEKPEGTAETTEAPAEMSDTTTVADTTTEVTTEPAKEETQEGAPDIEVVLRDRITEATEGRYNSLDELINKVEKPYANDFTRKIDELAHAGKEIDLSYIQRQLVNYDNFDPSNADQAMHLVRMGLLSDDPDMPTELLEFEMKDRYRALHDEYAEEESKHAAQMRLQRDARKFQKEMKAQQQQEALPPSGRSAEEVEAERVQQEKQTRMFQQAARKAVNGYESEVFTLGDETFTYAIDGETRKELINNIDNIQNYFGRFLDKSGNVQWDGLMKSFLILNHGEKILAAHAKQLKSKGGEEAVANQKNSTLGNQQPKQETNALDRQKKSMAENLAASMLK